MSFYDAQALAYYQLLKKANRLKDVLLAEYRCARGCLLMAMFQTPNGVAMYHHRWNEHRDIEMLPYVELMEKSVIVDGVKRWDGGEGDHRTAHTAQVRCKHLGSVWIDFNDDQLGTLGNPTRRIVNKG